MRPPVRLFRSKAIATAALCAATLLAGGAAQAALIVTSATRSVVADTSRSADEAQTSLANSGAFVELALSREFSNTGARAIAAQNTTIDALTFFGSGSAELSLPDASGSAASAMTLFFTLTSSFSFSGDVAFEASGNATPRASFDLEEVGGASILSGNQGNPLAPFSGTLNPGNYSLKLNASGQNIDPNEDSFASFNFNLAFVDLNDPPPGVPEPQSLALLLAGIGAIGATRRRAKTKA